VPIESFITPRFSVCPFAAIFAISGCANPEKAKIAHVEKGEVY